MVLDPSIGSTVGGYRLVSLIARGGMGAVYLADDPRLDRRVALKIPAPELVADASFRDRFLRETKLAASLEHPAIVPVYDAGEEDGRLYLALRYVEGSDLAAKIHRSGPIEPRRLVRILSQVASALDAADSHGLVHRDVKPGNILVGLEDQAYLSDFGLTKRQDSGSALTRTGQFLGTLDYVAPEMIEGREVTGAVDQYSLACVAFEALTGEPPFRRETDAATLYAHVHEVPPTVRLPGQEIPQAVDEVLRRGMAKRPGDRFASCRGFVEELDRALERPAKLRGRGAVLAVAALIGVAIVLVAVVLLSDGNDRQQAAPASTVSVEEERVLGRIPAPISASCERTTPGVLLPPASLASMTCVHDAVTVTYSLFDSARAMDDWFNQSIGVVQAFPGDCATDRKAEGTYTIDLVQAGRVLCYTKAGTSHIEWTDEGLLIHGTASREDLGDQELYVWWADEAGPLTERKDRSDVQRIPDGIYTMKISPSDSDGYAATHDLIALPSAWLGRWVLHLGGGQYQVEAPTEQDSMAGPYVRAKNGRVAFEVDNPFYCIGAFTETFDWEATATTLRLTSSDSNCGGSLWNHPPWDVHPWRMTK